MLSKNRVLAEQIRVFVHKFQTREMESPYIRDSFLRGCFLPNGLLLPYPWDPVSAFAAGSVLQTVFQYPEAVTLDQEFTAFGAVCVFPIGGITGKVADVDKLQTFLLTHFRRVQQGLQLGSSVAAHF